MRVTFRDSYESDSSKGERLKDISIDIHILKVRDLCTDSQSQLATEDTFSLKSSTFKSQLSLNKINIVLTFENYVCILENSLKWFSRVSCASESYLYRNIELRNYIQFTK